MFDLSRTVVSFRSRNFHANWQFHIDRHVKICLCECKYKINCPAFKTYYFRQNKQKSYTDSVYDWCIRFSIIGTPLLHPTMSTKGSLVLAQCAIWEMLAFERPDCLNHFHFRRYFKPLKVVPMLILSIQFD